MTAWVCNVGIGDEKTLDKVRNVFWTEDTKVLHLGVDWNPKIEFCQSWCIRRLTELRLT